MGINVASDTKAGLRFADMIVDGHKTLESRNSDTLRPYVGKRVAIVRTGEGKAKAIGEVTVGEPKVVNQKQFRAMEDEHKVPKGSRFDINTPTKHLYPMHDPVRYEEERDVGHGIVSRQVIHKATGGAVRPLRLYHGTTKDFKRFNVGSYLTDDPDYASKHGNIVMPVHMSATKIGHVLDEDFRLMAGEPSELKPYIDAGYDALKSDAHNDYIILDPSKVKSAITNKARGGSVEPTLDEMRQALAKKGSKDDYFSVLEERNMSNPRYREYLEKQQGLEGSYPDMELAGLGIGALLRQGKNIAKGLFQPKAPMTSAQKDANLASFLAESKAPPTLYHGTDKSFPAFDKKKVNRTGWGEGFHLAEDTSLANMYAGRSTGSNVMPVHASIKNPYVMKSLDEWFDKVPGKTDAQKTAWAKSKGYDGIKYPHSEPTANETGMAWVAFEPTQIKSAIGNRGTFNPNKANMNKADGGTIHMAKGGSMKEPKSTVKAYKLFRVHKDHPGKLFPLFVDANTPVEMNKWVDAKEGDMKDGKVKSKIGALAYRPGWHAGDLPMATHIGEKSDPSVTAPDRRPANHAWAEVEMPNDVDWQAEATKRGTNAQGKLVPVKAHITDQIPKGGHYRYKTNPNMTGNWLIGGSMKVNKVLSDAEVARINKKAGMADLPRTEPFAKKTFGFAQGGSAQGLIAPEEFKAEEYVNYKAEGGKVEPTQEQMREALRQKMRHGMYSPLERLAVDIPRAKGTGAEFMAEISKQKGFKPEELADRKIPIPEGKMTKLEFLKHLREHSNPPLQEFEMPDMGYGSEVRNQRANDYYGDDYDKISPEQQIDVADWVRTHNAKYSQYQLPGAENYREMLLKLPALSIKDERAINYLQLEKRRVDPTEWANSEESKRLETLMQKARKFDTPYNSGHWRMHPNTLAHVRLSDREGTNGEKLLHLEELQSDWHQNGRKKGYKPDDYIEQSNALEKEFKDLVAKRANLQYEAKRIGDSGEGYQALTDEANSLMPKLMKLQEQRDNLQNVTNYGLPDAPFKKSWHELGMKHVLHHAAKNGYDGVVITPGDVQKERWGDEGLKVHYDKKIPEFLNKFGKPFGAQVAMNSHRVDGEPADYAAAVERMGIPHVPMNRLTEEQRQEISERADKKLHYFPINDQMRTSILKEGMPQYMRGGVVHKAEGGAVLPIERIKAQMMNKNLGLNQLQSIGAEEAPNMGIKAYVAPVGRPDNNQMPVGGVDTSQGNLPVGGIDMSRGQPGNQLMPNPMGQQGMSQTPMEDKPPMDGMPPMGGMPPPQGASNILSMTPQGQQMEAMKPQGLAKGGSAKSIDEMKAELASNKDTSKEKRVTVAAPGAGGVKGIVVPKHLIEGNPKAGAEGLKNMMTARAKIYGEEHRDPLNLGQMAKIHKQTLAEHFAKPLDEQKKAEDEALNKIRAAKFIKHNKDTLDESEKLDTVEHEHDAEGRSHVGYASKGIAGHALYPKGHGQDMDYKVINTCPGQTEGCGGGMSAEGIVDTKKGACFAPNAESQYAAAVSRRAGHAIAKHDPAMTRDWVIAHTGSMRSAANRADKQNKRMLFRPNVVDETDLSSRHIIRHLNEQRKVDDKPPIIANSYGKTNELHDPENGYHITHSNVGPKVKKGREITENIGRDKARVRNTVMAADNQGDFKNEQGHKTPPKGSYMVTDVKRGSPMAKKMEGAITHAKYWTTGRSEKDLSDAEREEGPEAHYSGTGRKTSEDKAHYGHTTHEGLRYDYQKQHVLHPRLVQVGKNDDGTPHIIPTDSRFMDTAFLPKNRYKTKNGKEAGHILMTTPTESTSNIGHQTKFNHNVSEEHIEHALKNNGEYVIDKPEDQAKAKGKEYAAPEVIKFHPKPKAYAMGGSVGDRHIGFSDDDFHAFPEQNVVAQRHLAMRGDDHEPVEKHSLSDNKRKVTMNKDMDTMLLELTRNKKAK
jgi:hypothetical protein